MLKMQIKKCCCISRINNTQVDDGHKIDVVVPMYNLGGYIDNYSKISRFLWQCCRDKPASNANGDIVNFKTANATTNSFTIKENITEQTGNNGRKDVEIMVQLKYISNFWRTLEMLLINLKILVY